MARSMVGAGFEKGGNWVRSMGTHLGGWRLYQSEAGPSLCWRGRGGGVVALGRRILVQLQSMPGNRKEQVE